jgi:hypothetical protein
MILRDPALAEHPGRAIIAPAGIKSHAGDYNHIYLQSLPCFGMAFAYVRPNLLLRVLSSLSKEIADYRIIFINDQLDGSCCRSRHSSR